MPAASISASATDTASGPAPVSAAATEPQPVIAPAGRAAIFIVLGIQSDAGSLQAVRAFFGDVAALVRAVGHREDEARLSCIVGVGSDAWDRLFGQPRPSQLHPFREFRGNRHAAMATPGDLLLHLRAERMDLCFELAMQLMGRLGSAVRPIDEVHGFRYFDARAMVGFVDGTENPRGAEAFDAAVIGDEDPTFAGGSYVIVQKYLHDMQAWNALSTEDQERAIGRTKLADVELDDAVKPANAHNALTVIVDENGVEQQILRDNMPFGNPSTGEYGTYFIGYARTPAITEQMLENMFIGVPPGNHDRLLDFSRAVTGTLFFVPSAGLLESLADRPGPAASALPGAAAAAVPATASGSPVATPSPADGATQADAAASRHGADGSLSIGSLRSDRGNRL